jgi:cytidylate kinase
LDIGKKKIDEKVALEVAKNLIPQEIDEKKIRNREVDEAASIVSSISGVRQSLKKLQRDFKRTNAKKNGIVVDGRDIGTVIFPKAEIKLFVTASLDERASRRHNEFIEKELKIDKKLIIKELQKRDQRDKERSIAPLKIAKGALILDTSNMSIDRVMEKVSLEIDKVIENLRK